ncbi:hypothetical protein EVAR_49817_1 [Eumeta japonica]|uniref:Uncharacterized protein n=1 Tax=Eumeta variegata TaxID=151549 RepID=A0A4C1XQN3_EUMVA|nr:hypothetical protein EVAR_49817_1 [Eumeta japonica]
MEARGRAARRLKTNAALATAMFCTDVNHVFKATVDLVRRLTRKNRRYSTSSFAVTTEKTIAKVGAGCAGAFETT